VDLIADTSFLIGLWRRQPWAVAYASAHPAKSLGLPWVVLGEFWHGAIRAGHDSSLVRGFLSVGVPILDPEPVIAVYGRICSAIQEMPAYREIGQNDLWIAAVSVALGKPLITRNIRHFGAIPDLRVEVLG
jgi:predicted nucleic acid-binding protein